MPERGAKRQTAQLVDKWRELGPTELREYNEENTKNVFIQPLFEALGWDFHDLSQVTAEHRAGRGRVDFAFRVRGVSRFYLEAKPLRLDLAGHLDWVKAAVGYAYSKGIPWAILTNFKDLWVFTADDESRRFVTLSAEEFEGSFDRLWLLSRASTESGLLEREGAREGAIPPRIPIERLLFDQLKEWRERLFNEIHKYQPRMKPETVDEVIQKLFNRLVFIKTCEDRRIEEPDLISAVRQFDDRTLKRPLLQEVRSIFRKYDQTYDSDLFSPHLLDGTFGKLPIDEPTLRTIVQGLYDVPGGLASYDFAAIDADILGAVYEQYLGYVAQVAKQRARQTVQARSDVGIPEDTVFELTSRRQRRKQQGIYYTPTWVVDYIVRQTLGKFVEENSDSPDRIHEVKVLDMACGSGSFLIRAYDELLKWHADNFGRSVTDIDPHERTLVLRNNIFGVDLDPQAVEIARLNLLLRALAQREVLPSLEDNVKVGNSLVSGGEDELRPFFGDGWEARRPFDWDYQFKKIMDDGGFDIVIGNPPYVRIQSLDRAEANYYRAEPNYESAFGSFDLSVVFLERGLQLVKPGGRLGFITSGKFLKAVYGKKLQQLLRKEATVEEIVDLSTQAVFGEATNYPVILVLRKESSKAKISYKSVTDLDTNSPALDLATMPDTKVGQEAITAGMWPPPFGLAREVVARLLAHAESLGRLSTNVFQGLITSADQVYHLEQRSEPNASVVTVFSRALRRELELESDLLKPLLSGKHIHRYVAVPAGDLLLFPYKVADGQADLIAANEFAERFPRCWEYLSANRDRLEGRERGKMRHDRWYAFGRSQSLGLHDFRKLAIPRLVRRLQVFYDSAGEFYLDNVDVGGVLLKDRSHGHYLYVLGLLNSKLLDWYFQLLSAPFRGGFRSANRQFIEPLPIRCIDSSDGAAGQIHDAIVGKVERMLELQQRLAPLREIPTSERDDLQREVNRVDSEIDGLVYELYGLTRAERRLVEEAT